MASVGTVVGHVAEIWRYPVKSMAGQSLAEVDVGWHGLAGDRRWSFVRPGLERSGFPWLTIREHAALARHRPAFVDPGRPDASPLIVSTPDGLELEVTDPALASAFGPDVRVMKQDRGIFDVAPVSLITTRSVRWLAQEVASPLEVGRFRPNLVVEPAGAGDFPEDDWVGAVLEVGAAAVRVDQRDERCVLVNVDPATGARDPRVLRAIAQQRQARLGVYGTTVAPGRVAVGEAVVLRAPERP